MGLNIEALESSFAALAPQGDALVTRFYEHLFADYPEVKPLFKNDNRKALLTALAWTVSNLRNQEVLAAKLGEMGQRHVGYGVTEAHYPMVGATLLKTFGEFAGDLWTDELKQAWADAYATIQELMLAGVK